MKELLLIIVSSALVNNVVLSQFMGLCPFLGVSKTTDTAAGMGGAVIFVITLSSFVTSADLQADPSAAGSDLPSDHCVHSDHCSTGAVRRNVPEEKYAFSLQSTWRVSASDHHKLRSSWCGSYKRAEGLQYSGRHCKRFRNSIWFLHFYCADGRNP